MSGPGPGSKIAGWARSGLENRWLGPVRVRKSLPRPSGGQKLLSGRGPSSKIATEAVQARKSLSGPAPGSKIAAEAVRPRKSLSRPSRGRKSLPRPSGLENRCRGRPEVENRGRPEVENRRPTDQGRAEAARGQKTPRPGFTLYSLVLPVSDVLGPGPNPETRRPDRVLGKPEKAQTRHSRPEARNFYA